jgi:phosphotransferase system enzyme I (PtsP)
MLELLRRIVQTVNAAPDLGTALQVIVERVKQAIQADVCSVYLSDFDKQALVLEATEGLHQEAVGRVSLPFCQGLIGLVCERAEPVNVPDAPAHPRYVFMHETGEKRYHAFLGVPIIQNRRVLGVLVVRQLEPRSYGDDEVTFLVTLGAQLAGAITHARASGELDERQGRGRAVSGFLDGRPGAPGVALGRVTVVYPPADLDAVPDRPPEDVSRDQESFRAGVAAVIADLRTLARRVEGNLPVEDQALFDAWLLMLDSDSLIRGTLERIAAGNWAPGALRQTIEEHARVFDAMDDIYLRERASDVRDLGRRILMYLQTEGTRSIEYPPDTILAGEEISAIQLAEVPRQHLVGVVSARGSSSSHVAILARAMGIPAAMGVTDLPVGRMDGRRVIIDGYRGRIYLSPPPSVQREYARLAAEERALSADLEAERSAPSRTRDGFDIPLYLNTGLVLEANGGGGEETAAGVGLYRTELPFMVRDRFPGEAVQRANYRRVLEAFAPRPVVMRTLDIGGDKPLPYFPVEESNPFLGWRGIRISLDHPEIFLTQVRAMLQADAGLYNLRLLLPMVSTLSEVDDALELIQRAHDELREEGHAVRMPALGAMIEVPAMVYQAAALARRVDFLSIGTNDLTQYLLAVDRNNAHVAELYDDLHPAVLAAVLQVVEGARSYQREVSVCGEMAGNPEAALLLLGMGVNSLSMSVGSLLRVKRVIRSFTCVEAREMLQAAIACEEPFAVHLLMKQRLEDKGLGGLIRPGR